MVNLPTIDELRARAHHELLRNSSITVYRFRNGREVNRRPANPITRLHKMLTDVTKSFAGLNSTIQRFADQVAEIPLKIWCEHDDD